MYSDGAPFFLSKSSLFERILFSFWWAEGGPRADFVFYYNSATEQSTYEHPMDDFYRKVYQRTATRPPDRTALLCSSA